MTGVSALRARLQGTAAPHLADQVLSSGTNFVAVVLVARSGTPRQFGVFSILLVTYFVAVGFTRSVPHAIAMTLRWDDDRARNGYFFLPALAVGVVATIVLAVTFAILEPAWVLLALLLLPVLLQDAVRMHAFAVQKPHVALLSDATWLVVECIGFALVTTAIGAAAAWGIGGLFALLVTRPWRIRLRVQRRPVKASAVSATVEYATLAGLSYMTPLLASPLITVVGVGALQGANVIRGPIILFVQGLILHRMSGPPITPGTCVRQALRLAGSALAVTVLCIPPLFLLRGVYGPLLLGSTWPQVDPLVVPALVTLVLGSVAFSPATVARKMGSFALSARVQGTVAPLFLVLPLVGAAAAGTRGFLYATAGAYAVLAATWWIVLSKLQARPVAQAELAAT